MRCVLLAFALGVIALQQQATLPPASISVYVLIPLVIAAVAVYAAWRSDGIANRVARATVLASVVIATALAGFC